MIDEDLVRFFSSAVKGGFYGDIRLNETEGTSITVENGRTRSVSGRKTCGFGLRLMKNAIWAYSSSNEVSKKAISAAIESAYAAINSKIQSKTKFDIHPEINDIRLAPKWKIDPRKVDISKKLALVLEADTAMKGKNTVSTYSSYSDTVTHWIIGSTFGNLVSFYESHPNLGVASFVKDGTSILSAKKTFGRNSGFEFFTPEIAKALGSKAKEEAENLIGAKQVRGGKYDVVLDYSMTGVYTHEAFGHATEADGIINGTTVLENKLGKKVGSERVTIIDDPTIDNANGSFVFDQEGTRARKRVLVENGILNEYLNTLETAERLHLKPNGAARCMGHASRPIPRMSNTFIAPGDFEEDIYEDVKNGIAFYGFQYGYVEPASGKFMFKSQYGRIIKNGKLREFIRDAALTGSTLDILNRIDAVGKDFDLDGGFCGKENQWVPVTSGGPSIRIKGVVVGGH